MSNVYQKELVNKDILIQDNTTVLLYSIYNCLLSVENGDRVDAFYVTYQIRTYHNYEFNNIGYFSNLNKKALVNDYEIEYDLLELDYVYACAKFSDSNYEYFIRAHGLQNVTDVNEDNFINLLNKILL